MTCKSTTKIYSPATAFMHRRAQLFPVSRASSSAQIQAVQRPQLRFSMSASNASQHKKKCGSCYGQPEKECNTGHHTPDSGSKAGKQCLSTAVSGQAAQRPAENDTSQMCKHSEIQWQKLSQ